MSQRQVELVREDLAGRLAEYEEGLFQGIMVGVLVAENDGVPPMPERLRPYSTSATNEQINRDASAVFAIWLRGRHHETTGARFTSSGTASSVPCASASVIDAFLPDYPYAEDFVDGADDLLYRLQYATAEREMATAKEVCITECPLRIQCLARSVKADGDYPQAMDVEPWVVAGGWGPVARASIARRFHELRRNYINDRMPAEERAQHQSLLLDSATAYAR